MKKILLLLLFLSVGFAKINAQVSWPTYFINPPTSGCNGLWAINTSSTLGSCGTQPYTYMFSPTNCGQTSGLYFGTDTLFIPLCSLPCNFTLANSSGQTCNSSTGTTGIKEGNVTATKIFPTQIKPGGVATLEFSEATSRKIIQLFDNNGRSVENLNTENNKQLKLTIPATATGIYFIVVTSSDGWTELHKIFIE